MPYNKKLIIITLILFFALTANNDVWSLWLSNQGAIWVLNALVTDDKGENLTYLLRARQTLEQASENTRNTSSRLLGLVAYRQQDYDFAKHTLMAVVSANPHDLFARLWLANTYDVLDQPERALVYYSALSIPTDDIELVRFSRNYPELYQRLLYNNLAATRLAANENQPERAQEYAAEVLLLDSDNISGWFYQQQIAASHSNLEMVAASQRALAEVKIVQWQDARLAELDAGTLAQLLGQGLWEDAFEAAVTDYLLWRFPDLSGLDIVLFDLAQSKPEIWHSRWVEYGIRNGQNEGQMIAVHELPPTIEEAAAILLDLPVDVIQIGENLIQDGEFGTEIDLPAGWEMWGNPERNQINGLYIIGGDDYFGISDNFLRLLSAYQPMDAQQNFIFGVRSASLEPAIMSVTPTGAYIWSFLYRTPEGSAPIVHLQGWSGEGVDTPVFSLTPTDGVWRRATMIVGSTPETREERIHRLCSIRLFWVGEIAIDQVWVSQLQAYNDTLWETITGPIFRVD